MKEAAEIQCIIDAFGMKASIVAKAMKVTTNTVRKKKSSKELSHSFNQENLQDLKKYILKQAQKINL